MPYADATYPMFSQPNGRLEKAREIADRLLVAQNLSGIVGRDRALECMMEIRPHIRKGESMCLDTLLRIEQHDADDVMRVCAEAFRCIDIWVKRADEALLKGGE